MKVRNGYPTNHAVPGSKEESSVAHVNLKSLCVPGGGRQLYLLLSIPPSTETCWHFQSSLEAECGVESHGFFKKASGAIKKKNDVYMLILSSSGPVEF